MSDSTAPELSLNNKLRLRGGAVNLSREGHKARRKLDQLQRARMAATPRPEAKADTVSDAAPPDTASTDPARDLIAIAREAIQASGKKGGIQGFSLNHQQRRAAETIAKNLQRNRDEHERREAVRAATAATPTGSTPATRPAL